MSGDDGFLNENDVQNITKLSRTTRWRMERRGEFPKRRQLSPNRVGWLRSEVVTWVEERNAVKTADALPTSPSQQPNDYGRRAR